MPTRRETVAKHISQHGYRGRSLRPWRWRPLAGVIRGIVPRLYGHRRWRSPPNRRRRGSGWRTPRARGRYRRSRPRVDGDRSGPVRRQGDVSATTRSATSASGPTAAHARGHAAAVDPLTALSVGLKVDSEALPAGILEQADLEIRRRPSRCSSSTPWWASRARWSNGQARERRHHLRALPLGRGRLGHGGHRQAPRRLCRTAISIPGASSSLSPAFANDRGPSRAHVVGHRDVRRALEPGRHQRPDRHPAHLRAQGRASSRRTRATARSRTGTRTSP